MSVQVLNQEMIDLLSAVFQRLSDNAHAWTYTAGLYQLLPGVRGAWSFASFDENGKAYDLSGQGRVLSPNNAPTASYDSLVPFVQLDGVNQFYSRGDEAGLSITGPLTIGGWFRFGALGAVGLISKWYELTNQRSYRLHRKAGGQITFEVSGDGAAEVELTGSVVADVTTWHFLTGCYTGLVLEVQVDSTITTGAVPPFALFDCDEPFEIGRTDRSGYFTGDCAIAFACATELSSQQRLALFYRTRPLFVPVVTT